MKMHAGIRRDDGAEQIDWQLIVSELAQRGFATARALLSEQDCEALIRLYDAPGQFRSRVIMSRHGFGRGEYQYFDYPLPAMLAELRAALYARLVGVANRWNEQLGITWRYPLLHPDYLIRCRDAGQTLPTPLLLKYGPDDFNCLHQDLYGEQVFPVQATILLSQPGKDFTGGEFILTEQRPRMQSRAEVVPLSRGDVVVFAVHHRPMEGAHGIFRVNHRHGVSRVRTGCRYTAGVVFHDAKPSGPG